MTSRGWPAPAKLNLFLQVTGRRPDGFHELQTAFQIIDLCDSLDFEVCDGGTVKRVAGNVAVAPEEDLVVTSVMPCVRKQGEADRALESSQTEAGHRHVDHVVTTKVRIDLDLIELVERSRSSSRFLRPHPHTHALSLPPSLLPPSLRVSRQ